MFDDVSQGQFIRPKTLASQLAISRSTLYRRIKNDENFPKPVKIGNGKATRFLRSHVQKYIEKLASR